MLSSDALEALARLVGEVFRTNGRLLAAGDELLAGVGLTSARWQVLGSISKAGGSATVAQIARDRGLTRQGVQRVVNDLLREGLLVSGDNPRHQRAYLLSLTPSGQKLHAAADALALPWLTGLASGVAPEALASAAQTLALLRERLERGASEPTR